MLNFEIFRVLILKYVVVFAPGGKLDTNVNIYIPGVKICQASPAGFARSQDLFPAPAPRPPSSPRRRRPSGLRRVVSPPPRRRRPDW